MDRFASWYDKDREAVEIKPSLPCRWAPLSEATRSAVRFDPRSSGCG
jgi:hypothetical protein